MHVNIYIYLAKIYVNRISLFAREFETSRGRKLSNCNSWSQHSDDHRVNLGLSNSEIQYYIDLRNVILIRIQNKTLTTNSQNDERPLPRVSWINRQTYITSVVQVEVLFWFNYILQMVNRQSVSIVCPFHNRKTIPRFGWLSRHDVSSTRMWLLVTDWSK